MDKALFIANGYPESQVTIMTMIKQSSVIIAILSGKFIFREKNILQKMICAAIIIIGILIGIMGQDDFYGMYRKHGADKKTCWKNDH